MLQGKLEQYSSVPSTYGQPLLEQIKEESKSKESCTCGQSFDNVDNLRFRLEAVTAICEELGM